jgi:geranylgeranyl diphosphate synthase type II
MTGADLGERRDAVEAALERALPPESAWPATLNRAMRYSVFAGGKRIRPLLALGACEAAGGVWPDALPLACALELVHTFSLIHDDLPAMDDDDLRRGRPTSHKVFGEAIAILAGDALLARAFQVLLPAGDAGARGRYAEVAALLAGAASGAGLIGGQVEDMESEGREVDGVTLERIHAAKTGALIHAAVRGGGLIAGAAGEAMAGLDRFGRAIGLAFQVVDDVLDVDGSPSALGKTAGKDAAQGKPTFVALLGINGAKERAEALRVEAREALAPLGAPARRLSALADWIVLRDR